MVEKVKGGTQTLYLPLDITTVRQTLDSGIGRQLTHFKGGQTRQTFLATRLSLLCTLVMGEI